MKDLQRFFLSAIAGHSFRLLVKPSAYCNPSGCQNGTQSIQKPYVAQLQLREKHTGTNTQNFDLIDPSEATPATTGRSKDLFFALAAHVAARNRQMRVSPRMARDGLNHCSYVQVSHLSDEAERGQ